MKRLICEQDVVAADRRRECLYIDSSTIVTPQAADTAKRLNVELRATSCSRAGNREPDCHQPGVRTDEREGACCDAPRGQHEHVSGECHPSDTVFTADEIRKFICAAVHKGIWPKDQLLSLSRANECAGPREAGNEKSGTGTSQPGRSCDLTMSVGVSGRHLHLSREHLEQLFGAGYELTPIRDLTQPGQYAAKETVTLAGPKGVIGGVRIIGPARKKTQVEILATDSYTLGVPKAVRMSGNLEGTPGITIVGPRGTVVLGQGVIVAQRHIHMLPCDARKHGLKNGQIVSVAFAGERGGRFDNVVVRVDDASALDCHIDMEEANAFGLKSGSIVRVIKDV